MFGFWRRSAIYTKIFIGMAVGAILGFMLGPRSTLLEQDEIYVAAPRKLELLSAPGGGRIRQSIPDKVPVRMAILETRHHKKDLYFKVAIVISKRQVMKDRTGQLKPDMRLVAWVKGAGLPEAVSSTGRLIMDILEPVGRLFLRLIKMIIVPLVFASLLVGVASLGDIRKLGRLGGKTLGYFLLTTTIAISIGLAFSNIIKPGSYIQAEERQKLMAQYKEAASEKTEQAAEQPSAVDNLLSIVPENPVKSMSGGDMLQIIFFAVFFGVALTLIPKEKSDKVVAVFDAVNDAMVMCVTIIMKLAPYGVLALVANVVGQSGASVLIALGIYTVTVMLGLLTHAACVYTSVVRVVGKVSPLDYWRAARPAQLLAFSTSSSSATLPVTMECAEKNLGISPQVSSFVLPLGSTVNMDGTALYQGVAAVFIAQVFGIHLTLGDQLNVVLTATLASIGAAGVPGVGMVTLTLVLTSIGVPTVGVALILGVDRILDMFRSSVNVTGDLSAAVMVAATEGETPRYLPGR
jgi:Na+/H+-dicarboxylate symporter